MSDSDIPTTDELRNVLNAAVGVAKAGLAEKPSIEPPNLLKRLVKFNRLPDKALEQVRSAIETDDEFRERVTENIKEDAVGPVGWLWLTRPEGWEQEYHELVELIEAESATVEEDHAVEELQEKLDKAEAALDKSERQRKKAEDDRDEVRSELVQLRTEARRAGSEAEQLSAEAKQLRGELEAVTKDRDRNIRRLNRTEQKLKSAQDRSGQLKKDMRDSQESLEEELAVIRRLLEAARAELEHARNAGFEPPSLEEPEPNEEPDAPAQLTRREPAALPPGLLKDTTEAVKYLLSQVSDLVVLIDGYNVTFKNWQEMPVRDQRDRFMLKVEELSARYSGVEFVVVFDGAQTDYDYIHTTSRSLGVRVLFSPPDIEADDMIINLCHDYPLSRHLAVVSEDGRVRTSVREVGANLVHPRKLLEIMGIEVPFEEDFFGFGSL